MSGRPLDVLEASVGDQVTVRLKGGEIYDGVLAGYDQHMNLVLEEVKETHGSDPDEDPDAATPEERGEMTIIRGDNLVSISA
ncbi:Like-Sm ribonucleoprotein core [Halobacteriales archaeon QS_8_69_26]|nr:MAG: Like-Sm ribonucleoprotein core [Halobacteriales archaeon QS_8_69_26]